MYSLTLSFSHKTIILFKKLSARSVREKDAIDVEDFHRNNLIKWFNFELIYFFVYKNLIEPNNLKNLQLVNIFINNIP